MKVRLLPSACGDSVSPLQYLTTFVVNDTIAIDARPSDAIALALRTRAPIFVEDSVVESAKGLDLTKDNTDSERLQKWLEGLNPEDLGKYKM